MGLVSTGFATRSTDYFFACAGIERPHYSGEALAAFGCRLWIEPMATEFYGFQ